MLNNVIIMGRLVADPELRFSQNAQSFVTFTIANPRDYDRDKTDYYDCMAFGKTADLVNNYFTRGRSILIRGHLQTNIWTDTNGKKHKDIKIITDQVYFCDARKTEQTPPVPKNDDYFVSLPEDTEIPFE